jgi:glycosyltransferase involved in cell wall biosynthesis
MRAYPDTYQNIKAMFIINPDSTDYDDFDFFDDDNYDDDDDEEVQEALEQMLDSVNSAEELSKMLDNFGLDEYSKQQIIEEFEKTYEDDDVKGLPSNKKE